MTKFATILVAILVGVCSNAQNYCDQKPRFREAVFNEVSLTLDVQYGSNINYQRQSQDLFLDIYEPTDDNATLRPLIIFAHGGSFIDGVKTDTDVVTFCNYYAQQGYVTVAMQYRLGWEVYNETGGKRAVFRALQDGKAVVRFLKENHATYKIDTNNIIFAGTSAGGFIGVHMAFLNEPSEIPSEIDTTEYSLTNPLGLDGLRGKTNDLYQHSDNVKAVMNLCGAIGDTSWMTPQDEIPLLSVHGTEDGTVPYSSDVIQVEGVPIIPVSGSLDIHRRARNLGFNEEFYTFCGAGHVPYNEEDYEGDVWEPYLDTTLQFMNQFLVENVLGCAPYVGDRIPYKDSVDCVAPKPTSVLNNEEKNWEIFPNPAKEKLYFQSTKVTISSIEIIDLHGKLVLTSTKINDEINIAHLPSGIYFLRVSYVNAIQVKRFVKL
jgi:para-nitrobenzyl esterase